MENVNEILTPQEAERFFITARYEKILDNYKGYEPGLIYMPAHRPSLGKSSFLLHHALNELARSQDKRT